MLSERFCARQPLASGDERLEALEASLEVGAPPLPVAQDPPSVVGDPGAVEERGHLCRRANRRESPAPTVVPVLVIVHVVKPGAHAIATSWTYSTTMFLIS